MARPNRSRAKAALPEVLEARKEKTRQVLADGLQGAWARVFLRANPGPFQYVAYEVTARGGAGVMSHLRGMMGRRDAIIHTRLVSRQHLRDLFESLEAIGGHRMSAPKGTGPQETQQDLTGLPKRSSEPVYELSFRKGTVEKTVIVSAPYAQRDPVYGRFINLVRQAVVTRVGDIGYHGPTGPASKRGFLHVDSVPSARVFVDGVEIGGGTPIMGHPLKAGLHSVRLESRERSLRRTIEVKIRAGRSTSVDLDLR